MQGGLRGWEGHPGEIPGLDFLGATVGFLVNLKTAMKASGSICVRRMYRLLFLILV